MNREPGIKEIVNEPRLTVSPSDRVIRAGFGQEITQNFLQKVNANWRIDSYLSIVECVPEKVDNL